MAAPGVRLEVEGTLEAVSQAVAQLRRHLGVLIAPDAPQDCDAIELGVAEVLTNIVLHGQPGDRVQLQCERRADVVEVLVRDRGRPIPRDRLAGAGLARFDFDPADLEGLPDHGMGLALVRSLFHSLDYQQVDGCNVLRLQRRLGAGAA